MTTIKTIAMVACLALAGPALAQYKCTVGTRAVYQEQPCPDTASAGKFRCFLDGEVIYSDQSCTKLKSKDQIAAEKAAAHAQFVAAQAEQARRKEAADRNNFGMRIIQAESVVTRMLRDPDSARFELSTVSWFSGIPAVCGWVSGRNGFGGYSDSTRYIFVNNTASIEDRQTSAAFNETWKAFCGP